VKKRVVVLQEYVPQYRVPLFELVRANLAALDIDFMVAAGEPSGRQALRGDGATFDGLESIKQLEFSILGRRMALRRSSTLIRRADLVIMEQARRNLDLYVLFSRPSRPRVALWGHGVDRGKPAGLPERMVSRWLLTRSDWFFAYTQSAQDAAAGLGMEPERMTVLNNSTDTSGLRRSIVNVPARDHSALRKALDLKGRTATYIGALDSYKRIAMLVETAIKAHAVDTDFRLLIAGDGEDRELVTEAAREHPFIHYMGPRFGEDKALLLSVSDILVSPGSVGLGVLDSFASLVPMAITEWPFHGPEAEYLENRRNAIVTRDTADALARGMLSALSDPDTMTRLKAHCRADAQVYTIENMADRFVEGIQCALELPKR
jgi:glycosyltransferase involved in cell wall biosynthesis